MEILRVENLTKVYGKGENEVRALDGVSFSVEKGEFVAVIGSTSFLVLPEPFSPMMILTKLITLHFYVGNYTIPFL